MKENKIYKKYKTIGGKIKASREKKEITQDFLAKKANIAYNALAKIVSYHIKTPILKTAPRAPMV